MVYFLWSDANKAITLLQSCCRFPFSTLYSGGIWSSMSSVSESSFQQPTWISVPTKESNFSLRQPRVIWWNSEKWILIRKSGQLSLPGEFGSPAIGLSKSVLISIPLSVIYSADKIVRKQPNSFEVVQVEVLLNLVQHSPDFEFTWNIDFFMGSQCMIHRKS